MKALLERAIEFYLLFWARVVMRRRRPIVVGITGSVGKTTTKEVIAGTLMHPALTPRVGSVWKSTGNMNNTRGVPLSILGYRAWPASRRQLAAWLCAIPFRALALAVSAAYPRVFVIEFAAGPRGDISRTAAAARPTIAVVTAIGPAHLEHFGTIERVMHEKGALVRQVPARGLVVLGADNGNACALERDARAPVVKVPGRGRALAEEAARTVCGFFGVPSAAAEQAIAEQPPVPGRLDILEVGDIVLIDDAYNANPLSMRLGLDTLAERGAGASRRVAILGDMKELGTASPQYHDEIGRYARHRADVVIGVGEAARAYEPDRWFATSRECAQAVDRLVRPGDCVLVKASNSVGLDVVAAQLKRLG